MAASPTDLALYVDNRKIGTARDTNNTWADVTVTAVLAAGHHRVRAYNAGGKPMIMNAMRFDPTGAVDDILADKAEVSEVFTASGIVIRDTCIDRLAPGVYIVRYDDGTTSKIVR